MAPDALVTAMRAALLPGRTWSEKTVRIESIALAPNPAKLQSCAGFPRFGGMICLFGDPADKGSGMMIAHGALYVLGM